MKFELLIGRVLILLLISFRYPFAALSEIIPIKQNNAMLTNSISALVQDSIGFIWVGTDNGLLKYDGYGAYRMLNNQIHGRVEVLFKDSNGNIWISSTIGVFLLKKNEIFAKFIASLQATTFLEYKNRVLIVSKDNFILSDYDGNVSSSLPEKNKFSYKKITSVVKDKKNNIWIGTERGLDQLYWDLKGRLHIKSILKDIHVSFLSIDSYDYLWYSSTGALYTMNSQDSDDNDLVLNNVDISTIYSAGNNIWIGTKCNGIYKYSIISKEHNLIQNTFWIDKNNKNELKNSISAFYEDNYSNIWIGTKEGLYMMYCKEYQPFKQIKREDNNVSSLAHNIVSGLFCDSNNRVWAGTSNGLNQIVWTDYINDKYKISHYINKIDEDNFVANNKIQSIIGIDDNNLMMSTKNDIFFFDIKRLNFHIDSQISTVLARNQMRFVRQFLLDRKRKNIYMAFASGNLASYDIAKKTITPIVLSNSDSWGLSQDGLGNLWVASGKDGLIKLILHDGFPNQIIFKKVLYNTRLFNNSNVVSILCDHNGRVWIGTSDGLYLSSPGNAISRYKLPYQDENCYIEAIVEDAYHNIWLFCINKIYKIPQGQDTKLIQCYEMDGEDIARAYYVFGRCVSQDGLIISGGINGIVYFDPLRINITPFYNVPTISSFRIFNQTVSCSLERGFKDISTTSAIVLKYSDNQFSFDLSSLYYPNPNGIKYAYKLDGYDKEWIHLKSGDRIISFTNVPPGKYLLKIKASDVFGQWSGLEKNLKITILYPWYNSWWCWYIYIILFFIGSYVLFRHLLKNYKLRQQKDLAQWKVRFFINLAHSFVGPVNLIQAPVHFILENFNKISGDEIKKLLATTDNSINKLNYLVSQLMEFRHVDLKKNQLNLSEIDIIVFIQNIYDVFEDLSKRNNVDFKLDVDVTSQKLFCDPSKIEIVIFNLLSSAFNYTLSGGSIIMKCFCDYRKKRFYISIIIIGQNEASKKIVHFFNGFRKRRTVDDDLFREQGIGLLLAKDFVEMHMGKMTIQNNEEERRSNYAFFIPLITKSSKCSLPNDEVGVEPLYSKQYIDINKYDIYSQEEIDQLPIVYLLDADMQFAEFVKYSLKNSFRIRLFSETESLILKLKLECPSLIISDIISEERQEGVNLCKYVKMNESLSFIPFVLTSSMNERDFKLLAYEVGADAYILKPYEISYLKIRIEQLLRSQKCIKERVKQELIVNPQEISITSADDIFLANLMNQIEENMDNDSLSIDSLANSLHVSRSMLYRKISNISNLSPIDFIKNVRLKRAAQLLETGSYTVSEVGFMVGFKDTSYFSTCFKRHYGISPKSYSLKKSPKK